MKTLENYPCFHCVSGHYHIVYMPYESTNKQGNAQIIPDVPHTVCDSCGDTCFSAEASKIIEFHLYGQNTTTT